MTIEELSILLGVSTTSIQNWEKDTIPDKKYWAKLAYVLNLDFDIVSQYAPVKGRRNPCPDLLKRKKEFIKFVEDNTTYSRLTDFDKEILDKALTIIMLLYENITQQKYNDWNEFLYTNAKEFEDISNYILLQKVYKIIDMMKDSKGWDKGNYLLREETYKYIAIGRKDKKTQATIDKWLSWSPKDNEKLSLLILILSNIIVNYSLKEDKEGICIELSDDEYKELQEAKHTLAIIKEKKVEAQKLKEELKKQQYKSHQLGIYKIIKILNAASFDVCDNVFTKTTPNGQCITIDIVASRNKCTYYIEFEGENCNEADYYTKFENILSITNHMIFITANDEAKRKIKTCWQRFCMKDFARYNSTKVTIATLGELQQDPYLLEK